MRLVVLLLLAALTGLPLAPSSGSAPSLDKPVVAALAGKPVEIHGTGFGLGGTGHHIRLRSGSLTFDLPWNHPAVLAWEDTLIRIQVPEEAASGWMRVVTPAGASGLARVDLFRYSAFDVPPSNTNAAPLAVVADDAGRVWLNQEFHLDFHVWVPRARSVQQIPIPKPPDPGPFASTLFGGDFRTQMSSLGEDIEVTPNGMVWFTQGGGSLYSGVNPNHSRIVSYDPVMPAGSRFRIWNMPGDQNEIIGLAWDPVRERMWVSHAGFELGARLMSFDPRRIPWDNHFDFSASLNHQICAPWELSDDCYRVYTLPSSTAHPAHMVVDQAGFLWYTAYWGRHIGRLDPDTGVIEEFPLPDAIGTAPPVWVVGPGPWEIREAADGNIVFNEFFDSTLCRFQTSRLGDPACLSLNAQGVNPCIDEVVIPDVDLQDEQVHSICFDLEDNLWYTVWGNREDPEPNGTLGYVLADFSTVVRLPPLRLYPHAEPPGPAGVTCDPTTGDIWFADFWRQQLGRLEKLPEL